MTTDQFPRFEPATKTTGKQPLFVDTNTLVAYLYERAAKHEEIRPAITAIGNNQLPYYPLVTNQYVLDEVVSLLLSRADTRVTHDALDRILATDSLRVLDVEPTLVDRAITQFREYRDQAISLTDHVIAVQATDYEIEHILTYDTGFRTLGFTTLPHA